MKNFGLQTYSIREKCTSPEEIRDSFRKVAEMGYSELQLASWVQGVPMQVFRDAADEAGLSIVGTHFGFEEMLENPEEMMERHRILGTVNIGIGGMPSYARADRNSLSKFIADANNLAAVFGKNGFKFTYHNHSFEFVRLEDGSRPMDLLAEGLDPRNTSFVLDTYWLQNAGVSPITWIEKLSGRIDILHLKDMGVNSRNESVITSIGDGNMEFKAIVKAAEEAGVSSYIVEQDNNFMNDDPMISVARSAAYMKNL